MNKFIRKGMLLLSVALPLTLGAGIVAFAEPETQTEAAGTSNSIPPDTSSYLNKSEKITDTPTINLLKDYVNGSTTQSDTKSPAEDFKITIEKYGLWNVGEDGQGKAKYTKGDMPTFTNDSASTNGAAESSNVFTITAPEGTAGGATKKFVALTVPNYEAVGDYWYKVIETDNNVAGVLYGTNDIKNEDIKSANGNHESIYYLHVQVTNATEKGKYIRTVTLHKTAPDLTSTATNAAYEIWYATNNKNSEDQTDKKVNDIQNKYYAGTLKVEKKVEGNAGDKNELFKVTVVFDNVTNASMLSDITYKNFYSENGTLTTTARSIGWKDTVTGNAHSEKTKSVDFYVQDGTTVEFDNIPYGVQYTVTETQPADDKYVHQFEYGTKTDGSSTADAAGSFNGVTYQADTTSTETNDPQTTGNWDNAKATGSISDDLDHVVITNVKESTIDIGVVTDDAPYVAILVLAGAVTFCALRRRRYGIEE